VKKKKKQKTAGRGAETIEVNVSEVWGSRIFCDVPET
jgi:hypothetical protein